VLIHSGGSYGGHYYAYIFDGKDWFKFNDSTVSKVSKHEIRQYGSNSEASNGTNAYLLFYRNVKTFKDIGKVEIPSELFEKVKI
jgi:ubiquitin C-terminal hydrolase